VPAGRERTVCIDEFYLSAGMMVGSSVLRAHQTWLGLSVDVALQVRRACLTSASLNRSSSYTSRRSGRMDCGDRQLTVRALLAADAIHPAVQSSA
jgi:hypothetical protein